MILLIDNFDSFTFNVMQALGKLGAAVKVVRNNAIDIATIAHWQPDAIVISPGPGRPEQAGISLDVIRQFAARLPILGICLGHQSLAQAFGGRIVHAKRCMHGKTSSIYHHNQGIFHGLSQTFQATRYHSLVVEFSTLPNCLQVTAWTQDEDGSREIMGLRHTDYPLEGVQFHPEAILTQEGERLLQNFLTTSKNHNKINLL